MTLRLVSGPFTSENTQGDVTVIDVAVAFGFAFPLSSSSIVIGRGRAGGTGAAVKENQSKRYKKKKMYDDIIRAIKKVAKQKNCIHFIIN